MIVKWRTGGWNIEIERVECVKETAQCVWIESRWGTQKGKTRRESKVSEWARFHDSWDAAKQYLLSREQRNIEQAKNNMKIAEDRLQKILELTEP